MLIYYQKNYRFIRTYMLKNIQKYDLEKFKQQYIVF